MPNLTSSSLSLWGLFLQADWIVKSVMIGLFLTSLWSWSLIFSKFIALRRCQQEADEVLRHFSPAALERGEFIFRERGPFAHLVTLAAQEYRSIRTQTGENRQGALQRLENLLSIEIYAQKERLGERMGGLASVGSTTTFIGLFGTVWGIMNSFQAIASSKNTSLAVVAPGIAEALFATAIGLVVAIPAVIAYNSLISAIHSYGVRMENFAQELIATCLKIRS